MPELLTLKDAFADFTRRNLAGQIIDGRTGEKKSLSDGRVDVIYSHVRAAVAKAVGMHPKNKTLLDVNILPLVAVLPEMAHLDARDEKRKDPANESASVRTFLRTVTKDTIRARTYKRRVCPESFLPDWIPLANVLWNTKSPSGESNRDVGRLETLQNVCLLHGVRRPEDMPDYATTSKWVREWLNAHPRIQKSSAANGPTRDERDERRRFDHIASYRKARKLLNCPQSLPDLERPRRSCERGIRALPNLDKFVRIGAERLRAQGVEVRTPLPTSRDDTLDLLDIVAPQIAGATRQYLNWTTTNAVRSDDWRRQVKHAASNITAELIRMNEDPFEIDYPDLFLQTRQIASPLPANSQGLKRTTQFTDVETLPLVRLVVDAAAQRSFLHSPLTLPKGQANAVVPLYTAAVFNDCAALWAVTHQVYGVIHQMESRDRENWKYVETVHTRLADFMKEYNDSREMEGHKDKSLVSANWGQCVCIGVARLWRRAQECRTSWKAKKESYGVDAPATERARREYCQSLCCYVLWAVLLDDGMRIANYAGARISRHCRLSTISSNGTRRVVAVETMFRGYDQEAGTKKRRRAGGRQNMRRRTLNPGVVDMDLFTDYVYMARVDNLVSAGLLPHRGAYNPDTDEFALFVSPNSTRAHGGYSKARLSRKWGCLLHWLTCDVLGHRDDKGNRLASWREMRTTPELRRKWRAIWGAHILRQIVATFMKGVLKDEQAACRMTNDTPATLDAFYNQFDDTLAELLKGPKGINHPEHFADVCRRLIRGEILDWGSFDPQRPDTARWNVPQEPVPAPPKKRARRKSLRAWQSGEPFGVRPRVTRDHVTAPIAP